MRRLLQWFCYLYVHSASLMNKIPKTQNDLWYASLRMQRSIDWSEDVFVEYPVCVLSVAVIKQRLFLLVLDVLCNRGSIFLFQ